MRWLVRIAVGSLVLLALPIGALSLYLDEAVSRAASYALGVEIPRWPKRRGAPAS